MRALRDDEKLSEFSDMLNSIDGDIAAVNNSPTSGEACKAMDNLEKKLLAAARRYIALLTEVSPSINLSPVARRLANAMTTRRLLSERMLAKIYERVRAKIYDQTEK